MKAIAIILAATLVAGCSGMRSSGNSGTSGSSSYQYWQYDGASGTNRHDDERDPYFGG